MINNIFKLVLYSGEYKRIKYIQLNEELSTILSILFNVEYIEDNKDNELILNHLDGTYTYTYTNKYGYNIVKRKEILKCG